MGLILPKPCLSKVIERSGNEYVGAGCASVNGYRTSMEDAHMLESPANAKVCYFGIFDGHSGASCSAWVAERMPKRLQRLREPINAAMLETTCQELDEEFLATKTVGGSTGTFCLLYKDGRLVIANVGDSRILHFRQGKLLFATEDHKPYDFAEELRITRAGGTVMNNRVDGDLAVSRAFGDSSFKTCSTAYREQKVIAIPDVTERKWEQGDILVIACDGVFEGKFSNAEVCKYVTDLLPQCSGDLAVVSSMVCDEAIRRGSKDNISCIVIQLGEGASKVKKFGTSSFVPGPPFLRNHESSRRCYEEMATMGNVTLAKALRRRYELLQARQANTLSKEPPVDRVAFDMSDDVDFATEESFFGRGPAPGSEEEFFEHLAGAKQR